MFNHHNSHLSVFSTTTICAHVYNRLCQWSPSQFSLLNFDNNLLSPILPNFLRTISRLNSLKIQASLLNWNLLNPSLTSALLHLMHLPTINHIDLSHNFPLPCHTPVVNLLRFDIYHLRTTRDVNRLERDDSELVVQSEMMPKIREFRTSAPPCWRRSC